MNQNGLDERFNDLDNYFEIVAKKLAEIEKLPKNLRSYIDELPLSAAEKNKIVSLHNSASDEKIYGANLYHHVF